MTDSITAEAKFHGGFGLAQLISQLATQRKRHCYSTASITLGHWLSGPVSRKSATDFPGSFAASAEYYAICDRIARGEKP